MTIIVVPYKFNVYLYITREESTIIIICRDRNKWLLVFQLYSTYPFHSTIHLFPFWKFPHLPFLILKYYDKFNNLTKWIYHSKHWWISKQLLSLDKWVSQKVQFRHFSFGCALWLFGKGCTSTGETTSSQEENGKIASTRGLDTPQIRLGD